MALARSAFEHARRGDTLQLKGLLEAGLPVDLCNENGDSLLMLACYYNQAEAARLLLTCGANPNHANARGQTPLAGVTFKNHAPVAELLLDHGAWADGAGADGRTALMYAAMFDRLEVLELLLARGASTGLVDTAFCSALDYARGMGAQRTTARLEALRFSS